MGAKDSKVNTETLSASDKLIQVPQSEDEQNGFVYKFIKNHQKLLTNPYFCFGLAIFMILLMIGLSFILLFA